MGGGITKRDGVRIPKPRGLLTNRQELEIQFISHSVWLTRCLRREHSMPCFHTGSAEGDARLAAREAQKELTEVMQMLCYICAELDYQGTFNSVTAGLPTIKEWWEEHKRIDMKRLAEEEEQKRQEAVAKRAKSKLTFEERKALGLR